MTQFVYGICREMDFLRTARPNGLDGRPVTSIAADGLAAVCSAAPAEETPSVSSLLAYARVIEQLYQNCTILPLRWGCMLDSPAEVAKLLVRRRREFEECLRRVEGCVEMGIRIGLGHKPEASARGNSLADASGLCKAARGTAYLLRRRQQYTQQDAQRQTEAAVLARLHDAFQGLFIHSTAGPIDAGHARLLSVAFLVRRAHEPPFRRAFERLQARSGSEGKEAPSLPLRAWVLTGPWPPYSFVAGKAGEPYP